MHFHYVNMSSNYVMTKRLWIQFISSMEYSYEMDIIILA